MKRFRFFLAMIAGKLCALFARVFFPSRGSNLPGEISCRIDPDFLSHIRGIDLSKTVFITGTNGKSTSNNLLIHAFETAGLSVASNAEGANLKPGVATVLIKNSSLTGKFKRDYLILEIDERSLPIVCEVLPAKTICITNIQKDQVQRNGDPDYIYQKIKSAINKDVTVFVNNDEPLSKSLSAFAGRTVSFGVAKNERGSLKETDFGVTMPCPVCHDALDFDYYNIANVGKFSCRSCGFKSDDRADVSVDAVDYHAGTFTIGGDKFKLTYDAAHFLYNYVLCYAVCKEFGIDVSALKKAFDTFTNVGGRLEFFWHGGKHIQYIRMKQENPETLQSVLDNIALDKTPKVFLAGLEAVHDIIPHYSNTFYAFDCNFEPLLASGVEKCIVFGNPICYDVANRFIYAGFPPEKIIALETDDAGAVLSELSTCEADHAYLIMQLYGYNVLIKSADGIKAEGLS